LHAKLFPKMRITFRLFFDCIMQATYFYFALFCASPHSRVPNIYFRGHKRRIQTQYAALFLPLFLLRTA
jgi:hypothetical protein